MLLLLLHLLLLLVMLIPASFLPSPSPLRPPLRANIFRLLRALTRSRGTRPDLAAFGGGEGGRGRCTRVCGVMVEGGGFMQEGVCGD